MSLPLFHQISQPHLFIYTHSPVQTPAQIFFIVSTTLKSVNENFFWKTKMYKSKHLMQCSLVWFYSLCVGVKKYVLWLSLWTKIKHQVLLFMFKLAPAFSHCSWKQSSSHTWPHFPSHKFPILTHILLEIFLWKPVVLFSEMARVKK